VSSALLERSADLLHREAAHLDRKRWDDWLALYEPDATFWMPCWDDDGTLVEDPRREISLMYYSSRRGLEERIARLRSGQSSASLPLPRTCHLLSGIRVECEDERSVTLESSFVAHSYRKGETQSFFGAYEHVLRKNGDQLSIARKKIVLVNDVIPSVLDVYSV
jgi:benzoate/toluate 1,2-dioxygenase subunit beta